MNKEILTKSSRDTMSTTTLIFLICFTLLRSCYTRNPFSDLDLSTQTLNPVTTGFMVSGSVGDYLGECVSTAGDIDNDGYDDIIIGAFGRDEVYVVYGGEESAFLSFDLSITSLNPLTTGFTIIGNAAGASFGWSLSTAGDINKDGYDDIIIGAPWNNGHQGAAYVIYGGAKSTRSHIDLSLTALIPVSTGFTIKGSSLGDELGISVSTAGDINKDGYADIIIGAQYKNAAYVIYGGEKPTMSNWDFSLGATLNPPTTGFMITGNAAGDRFGWSVCTAGDVNNDGYSDIIVGAQNKNSNQGAAYVIYGGDKSIMSNIVLTTALIPSSTGFTITGNAAGDRFGMSVSKAGDINKDGYGDIIVSSPYKNGNKGVAYVIYGGHKVTMSNIALASATLNPLVNGFMMTGNVAGDYFGYSVSTAGDVNNDGYADIIVGAQVKNSNQGAVYVIFGRPKSAMCHWDFSSGAILDPSTTGFTITGNAAGNDFGVSVSTAGDINNDGYDDIIVGAQGKNAAYVMYAYCPKNCKQCSSKSDCTACKNPYLLYQSRCFDSCPFATFISTDVCKDCPSYCSSCVSQDACQVCIEGFTLSNSLCGFSSQEAREKALRAVSSAAQGIGSVICVGSTVFPFSALVSKIVQNTRYLNLSVTNDLAEVYKTWRTELISWEVPNIMSDLDHFKTSPPLFTRYEIDSPFLVNFWPTLINIGIGFGTFVACILIQKLFEHAKYEGWAYSLVLKLVAGSFNFALIQAYACLDDILFYLVLDAKTNPFNSSFSRVSIACAAIFLTVGCLQVFFNFWTVYKYQSIKKQEAKDLIEAFNERNKYWGIFYSDFNDDGLWSQSFFALAIIRSALSSFIITILYEYPLMQTSYLVISDGAIILFLYFKTPFRNLRGTLAQYYYEIITLLVHFCAFILALQDSFKTSSDTLRRIMSTGILYLNTALICGAIGFMFIEVYKVISEKKRAARLKQQRSIPEDNPETQNLNQKGSPLQPSNTVAQRRQYWEQTVSIDNFQLEPENNQKPNLASSDFINLGSSQGLESNSYADTSVLQEMNPSHRAYHQRNQSSVPIMIRQRTQSMHQSQQRNNPRNPSYIINNE